MKLAKLSTIAAGVSALSLIAACSNGTHKDEITKAVEVTESVDKETTNASVDLLPISVVANYTDTRPGNITVTPAGRVILSQQPLDGPAIRLVEILEDGSKVPFPTLDWADGPEIGDVGIAGIIGVRSDSNGVVWLLDMGSATSPAQFIAWDSVKDELVKTIKLPVEVLKPISFLQDFVLDEERGQLYIADMTFPAPDATPEPAMIIVDTETGNARRILEGQKEFMPVKEAVTIDGSLMGTKLADGTATPWYLGLNPIAIDPEFEYVYFGTVNGTDIFRIPAVSLADENATNKELASQITQYADKNPSDGMIIDAEGRIFVTDIENFAIGEASPEGYRIIAQDKELLSWPDGFAVTPDGALLVTQDQLYKHPALNEGVDESSKNYHILKIQP